MPGVETNLHDLFVKHAARFLSDFTELFIQQVDEMRLSRSPGTKQSDRKRHLRVLRRYQLSHMLRMRTYPQGIIQRGILSAHSERDVIWNENRVVCLEV